MKLPTIQRPTMRVRRARCLVPTFIKSLPLLACLLLAISTQAQSFVLFGNQLVNGLSTVNGDVGVSGGGMLDLTAPATINGDLFLDTTATLTQMGVITGTTFDNQDLSATQSGIFSDSAAFASLPPNETFTGNQTMALNFDVPSGQFVVNLEGGLNLNNQNITVTGGGTLVLNIESSFTLAGSASIVGEPANIIVNYIGTSTVTTGPGDSIDGVTYIPSAAADLAGTFNGGILAGGETITLDSGAIVNPVPEPKELIFPGLAGLLFHFARRRICSLKI